MNNQSFSKIWIMVIIVILLAGGIFTWQYFGAPKEEIKAPEVKAPEEVSADKTADWKTYQNEKLGYKIKYPPIFIFTRVHPAIFLVLPLKV